MRHGPARVSVLLIALVVAVGASGCATTTGTGAASTAPSTTAPSPTPAPTTDAAVTVPVAAFGGDCASTLDPGVMAEVFGADASVAREPESQWSAAISTAGGIDCLWSGNGQVVSVLAFPADVVPAAMTAATAHPICETVYDSSECQASLVLDGVWILAVSHHAQAEPPAEPPGSLGVILDSAAAQSAGSAPPLAVTDSADSWPLPPACSDVGEAVDVEALLGPGRIYDTLIREGRGPLQERVAFDLGTASRCGWSEVEAFSELEVSVMRNAAWSLDAIVALDPDSAPADVPGAEEAFALTWSGGTGIIASDGVNLVWVAPRIAEGQVDTTRIAAEVLSTRSP